MTRRWLFVFALAAIGLALNFGPWALAGYPLAVPLAMGLTRLRLRRLGWRLGAEAAHVRDGVFAITRTAVRYSKIQSVTLAQTPFDRRHRMASLRLATAGPATGGFVVPYLPLRTARRLARRLAREAAEVDFQW